MAFEAYPKGVAALVSLTIVSPNKMGASDSIGGLRRGIAELTESLGVRSFFTSGRYRDRLSNDRDLKDAAYGAPGAFAAALALTQNDQETRVFFRIFVSTLSDLSSGSTRLLLG